MSVEMTLKVLSEDGDFHKYLEWPEGVRLPVEGEVICYDGYIFRIVGGAAFGVVTDNGVPFVADVAFVVERV